MSRLLAALALSLAALVSCPSSTPSPASAAKPEPREPPPRTAVIVLENHSYSQVVGASSKMPFFNGLLRRGTLATDYHAITRPSLPNYLAIVGGSTYGIDSDCTSCWAQGTNLAVQLSEARISWRAYMEGMPKPCYAGPEHGDYAKKHNPFMYFKSITSVPSLCRDVVPSSRLKVDLHNKRGLPTFTWITPNLCNDGHNCDGATVDRWLSGWVPRITRKLGSEGVLVITFDEGRDDSHSEGLHIPTLFVGPGARKGRKLAGPFDHYSLLATLEVHYGLSRINESAAARPLKGAFIRF